MEWIAGIIFLLYGLYRADLSLYQFDGPVIMYREPKDEFVVELSPTGWGIKHGNEYTCWFGSDGNGFVNYADVSINDKY